jgi:hypothetical protein
MRRAARALGLLVAMLAVLLVGAGYSIGRSGQPGPAPAPARPAAELLESLPVEPEAGAGYERDAFGDGWAIAPSGCDTRSDVLRVESMVAVTRGPDGCRVVAGRWVSVYDGRTANDPGEIEVDHLVALAEAWASGASSWPAGQREAFANDLTHADALVAVTAAVNRSKSDRDPAEWLPPNRASWCWYAEAWIEVKATWRLSVDRAEHDALARVLAGCPDGAS